MSASSSAPVESTMRGSSGRPGSIAALEPAATIALSNVIVSSPTVSALGPVKRPSPLTTRTLRPFAICAEAARELADDAVLPAAQRVDVDLGLAEGDAVVGGELRLGDDLRHVQQRLGRDAADVQADAAEALVALDEDDVEAEVGGAERGGVAADAGAEDEQLGVVVALRRCGSAGGAALRAGVAPSAPSRRTSGDPSDTLSPTLTSSSPTLPGRRARDLHRRLVGLQDDERVLLGDLLADLDEDLDDGDVGEVADVRDDDVHQSRTLRRSSSTPLRCTQKRAAAAPSITRWS